MKQSLKILETSNQNVYVADHADFDLGDTGGFETWFKPKSLPSVGALSAKWKTSGNQRSYGFRISNDSGTIKMQIVVDADGNAGGATVAESNAITVNLNEWNHFGFMIDSGTAYFYHGTLDSDTVEVGSGTSVGTPFSGSGEFVIGSERTDGTDGSDGRFYLARLWKGAVRTATELNSNRLTLLGSTTNLSGEWELDGTLTDNSGNGHTLTASNAPGYVNDYPGNDLSLYGSVEGTDYVKMTINSSEVPADQSWFVHRLDLSQIDSGDSFWTTVQSDGADIRIWNSTQTEQYPMYIESIDTTGKTGDIYFLAPADTDANMDILVGYNGSSEKRDKDALYGQYHTLENWAVVLHERGATYTDLEDYTGNGSDPNIVAGTLSYNQTAQVGVGVDHNGAGSFGMPDNSFTDVTTEDFTALFIIEGANASSNENVLTKYDGSTGYGTEITNTGLVRSFIKNGGARVNATGTTNISGSDTHYIATAYDRDGNLSVDLNGSLEASADISARSATIANAKSLEIGSTNIDVSAFNYHSGKSDEMWLIKNLLDSSFRTQWYNMMSNPASYWTYNSPVNQHTKNITTNVTMQNTLSTIKSLSKAISLAITSGLTQADAVARSMAITVNTVVSSTLTQGTKGLSRTITASVTASMSLTRAMTDMVTKTITAGLRVSNNRSNLLSLSKEIAVEITSGVTNSMAKSFKRTIEVTVDALNTFSHSTGITAIVISVGAGITNTMSQGRTLSRFITTNVSATIKAIIPMFSFKDKYQSKSVSATDKYPSNTPGNSSDNN